MNWNGKPRFCPHCGKEELKSSGIENMANSASFNQDHYKCNYCNNELDISYIPNQFIEVKFKKEK